MYLNRGVTLYYIYYIYTCTKQYIILDLFLYFAIIWLIGELRFERQENHALPSFSAFP